MKVLNHNKLMRNNPTMLGSTVNQFNQRVMFFEHPIHGDTAPIIAVIEGVAVETEFWDTDDFYEGSDYMPVLTPEGKIESYWESQI